MCGVLALLFLVVPALEIFVVLQVGSLFGVWPTLAVIAATAVAGAWLTKTQGLWAVRKLQEAMLTGRELGDSLVAAALVLVAGVIMLTPGFITDILGFVLLIPPARAAIARALRRRLEGRMSRGGVVIFGPGMPGGPGARGPDQDGTQDRRRQGQGKPPIIDL